MKANLYNQNGEVIGDVELSEKVFGLAMKHDLVQQALVAQLANARNVIAHTKDRSQVRGGGKKPWKQKGTGRARHASIRSPIWRGGGITFGPTNERNFTQKLNSKMKRKALYMVLSAKTKDKELMIVNTLQFDNLKTKEASLATNALAKQFEGYRTNKKKQDSILFIVPNETKQVKRALNNLSFVDVLAADSINIRDILSHKYLICLKDSIPAFDTNSNI